MCGGGGESVAEGVLGDAGGADLGHLSAWSDNVAVAGRVCRNSYGTVRTSLNPQ